MKEIMTRTLHHIALIVESLRQAENLYCNLFSMQVTSRDTGLPSAIAAFKCGTEEDTERDPRDFRYSILEGSGFCLHLIVGVVESSSMGRVAHLGLCFSRQDLRQLRQRASELSCRFRDASPTGLLLEDPLGVCWSITVPRYTSTDDSTSASSS